MYDFLTSLIYNPIAQWTFGVIGSWILGKGLDFLFTHMRNQLESLPKRISKTIKRILIILELPVNIVLFGISYPYELLFRYKCWVKVAYNESTNSWVWSLHRDDFSLLYQSYNGHSEDFECWHSAKKRLGLRFRTTTRKYKNNKYYRVYLSKSEYKGFEDFIVQNYSDWALAQNFIKH